MNRRFQFSLGRLLLAITFLTLLGSHVHTSWKLKQAREDIARLAKELGRLNISDSSRLNVVAQDTYEETTWRWRVHVPIERQYGIYSATQDIPLSENLPSAKSEIQTWLEPGEYTLTVAARPDHRGEWKLSIAQGDGALRTTIEKPDAEWLVHNSGYTTTQAGRNGTEAATSTEPLVLLKVNCGRNASGAAARPAPGATEGIMVWAVELGPDSLQTVSAAPSPLATAEDAPLDPAESPIPPPLE